MQEETRDFLMDPIDPDQLEVEWLAQPNLYMNYVRKAKRAKKEAQRAVEKVKTVRSELILEANRNGIEGIPKLSDPKVEAYYRAHERYQEAVRERIDAEHRAEVADGKIWACQQRKAALESLVILWGQEYFSSPREPKGTVRERLRDREEEMFGQKMKDAAEKRRERETQQKEEE